MKNITIQMLIHRLKILSIYMMLCVSCDAEKTIQSKNIVASKESVFVKTDTQHTVIPIKEKQLKDSILIALISKFQDTTFAPFGKISKKALVQTKKGKELHNKDVRRLTKHLAKHWSLDFPRFYLQKFYEIDTAKQINHYKDWLQTNGSEGNIVQATVYANQKMDFYGETDLLFWTLHHRTAEACPFAEGQVVFATIVHQGQIGDTFVIASRLSAGDAPISSEATVQTLLLGDASMRLAYHQEVREENQLIEQKRKVCKIKIQEGQVKFEDE